MAVLPVPPLFWKLPVLLIVAGPPRLLRKLVSPATSNVPVLLNVAPCPLHKSPPLKLVVPALLIVRCASPLASGPLNTRLPPPGITAVPLPSMLPPVQLSVPLTVNTPLPLRLPPLKAPIGRASCRERGWTGGVARRVP